MVDMLGGNISLTEIIISESLQAGQEEKLTSNLTRYRSLQLKWEALLVSHALTGMTGKDLYLKLLMWISVVTGLLFKDLTKKYCMNMIVVSVTERRNTYKYRLRL